MIEFLKKFSKERLQELAKMPAVCVVSITTTDGTCQTYGVLEEVPEGLIVRRQGGRIDLLLAGQISHVQLSTFAHEFSFSGIQEAPGNKITLEVKP